MTLPLFPECVQFHTKREPMLGGDATPETVTGIVVADFHDDLLVHFDGEKAIGSVAGCELLVPREDLEEIPASYWRISLRPAYRGASQETLDALLAECRAAERER